MLENTETTIPEPRPPKAPRPPPKPPLPAGIGGGAGTPGAAPLPPPNLPPLMPPMEGDAACEIIVNNAYNLMLFLALLLQTRAGKS